MPILLKFIKARKSFAILIKDKYNMSIETAVLMMGYTDSRTTAAHYVYVKTNKRKQSELFGKELNRLVSK